jgi:hypothetical protein
LRAGLMQRFECCIDPNPDQGFDAITPDEVYFDLPQPGYPIHCQRNDIRSTYE